MSPETLTFLNSTFEYSFVSVINKPTQVKKNTATAIDHGKVKHELRVTNSNPRVTSSNPRVASSNLQVTRLETTS